MVRGISFLVALCISAIALAGCSQEEPKVESGDTPDYRRCALEFVEALVAREYATAYGMTAADYRDRATVEQLRDSFEAIVPTDWDPAGPVEVGQTMATWPGKLPSDLGWAYVSIGGDVYSEAVTVVVTSEQGEARIREADFGRP